MRIDIITIFPEYFEPLKVSLLGKAISSGIIKVNVVNLRDYADPPHYNVDDTPYGGGAGMIMRVDILAKAIDGIINDVDKSDMAFTKRKILFTSPAGVQFNQQYARTLASATKEAVANENTHLIFICGRFEGYDARIIDYCNNQYATAAEVGTETIEISIGDYVLFGGEVAVLVMIEAITRLIPGVVGNPESLVDESHELSIDGETLLEYPIYTRPREFDGLDVPEVLLSGNHGAIDAWRLEQARLRTKQNNNE